MAVAGYTPRQAQVVLERIDKRAERICAALTELGETVSDHSFQRTAYLQGQVQQHARELREVVRRRTRP